MGCPRGANRRLRATVLEETRKLLSPTRGQDLTNIAELLAEKWFSQAMLDFLATTDVSRTAGPPVANEEDDAASEASEWEA